MMTEEGAQKPSCYPCYTEPAYQNVEEQQNNKGTLA